MKSDMTLTERLKKHFGKPESADDEQAIFNEITDLKILIRQWLETRSIPKLMPIQIVESTRQWLIKEVDRR